MILIVAFNARPIAQLAKELGLEIAIVDFWGDQDLSSLSDKVYTVFKPEFKSYAVFPEKSQNEELLVDLALKAISEESVDSILIGSGLDDRPDLWNRLNSQAEILGNSSECIKKVRNLIEIHKQLQKSNIAFPHTHLLSEISGTNYLKSAKFPYVIKPIKTLGGLGIQLIQNQSEFTEFLKENSNILDKFFIQEYIKGEDISTTMIGNKIDYKVLSINKQLIGIQELGTKLHFKYCGNIIPYRCPSEIAKIIENISIRISKMFKLSGVFGIDFVLKGKMPFFMEINPRFPGTIEPLYLLTNLNAVELHLNSIKGILPEKIEDPHGYAMKCILFAKSQLTTPHLENISHLSDIPPPGILLNEEDPVGSILMCDQDLNKLRKRMSSLVNQVYLKLRKVN